MIRWYPLAREECKAIVTSKGVWLLAVVLLLWVYRPTQLTRDELGSDVTIGFVQFSTVLLSLAVVLLAYRSIAGDRATGRLKFVLGLPLTRGEILLGKLVGRTAGIAIPTFVAFVVVTAVGAVQYGLFSPLRYLGVLAVTFAYIVVLTAIAVGVSATVSRTITAAAVLFVGLFLPDFAWNRLSISLYSSLTGTAVNPYDPVADGKLFLLARLMPSNAYNTATNWLLDVANSANHHDLVLSDLQPDVRTNALVVDTTFTSVPWYLHEAGALAILAVWGLIPLSIGYYRFNRGDLV